MTLTQIKPLGLSKPVDLADNEQLRLGTGNDLKIYHDGNNSRITNSTGALSIQADDININNAANNEQLATFTANGAVELFYDHSKKFETLTNGVKTTGSEFITEGTVYLEKSGAHHHRILANDTGNDLGFQQSSDTGANTNFTTYLRIKDGGDISLPVDGKKLLFGAGNDLEIYHDGNQSYIDETGTGGLLIKSGNIYLRNPSNADMIHAQSGGYVKLYFDGSQKFETKSDGATISGSLYFPDATVATGRAKFGNSDDLQIYHDATNGSQILSSTVGLEIKDTGGFMRIRSDELKIQSTANETYIEADANGAVQLFYDNSKKLETTNTGVAVNGNFGINGSGNLYINTDGSKANFGAGQDLQIFHNGTDSYILNSTGYLYVDSGASAMRFISDSSWTNGKMAAFYRNGAVELYYDNSKKFETTSAGFALQEDNTTRLSFTYSNSLNFITANAGNEIKVSSGNGDANGIEFWDYTGVNKRCQIDGHGIKFNADTAAANALDDYEEGTFTPSATFETSDDGNKTYSSQTGVYTKIGRAVHCNINLVFSNRGTGSGRLRFTNLPFNVGARLNSTTLEASGTVGYFAGLVSSVSDIKPIAKEGTNYLVFYAVLGQYGASTGDFGYAQVSNSFSIRLSLTYFV